MVSAYTGENVEDAFKHLIQELYVVHQNAPESPVKNKEKNFKLQPEGNKSDKKEKKGNKKCCEWKGDLDEVDVNWYDYFWDSFWGLR